MSKPTCRPFSRQPGRFESLEPRQLLSGTAGSGQDLYLTLDDGGQVVQTVSVEQHPRDTTFGTFKWYDSTPGFQLTATNSAIERATTDGYYFWKFSLDNNVHPTPGPVASELGVRALARDVTDAGINLVIFDNETWHFDVRFYSRQQVDKSIADMRQAIGWLRDERPQLKVGIYGYMSQSDDYAATIWSGDIQNLAQTDPWYAASLPKFAERIADWQATSDYLSPLANDVDYMFPALYTGTTDPNSWADVARNTIEDSRRYGKPVIPFIWPYYHEGIGNSLGGTELPQGYWQRQLDTVRDFADGAVIWNQHAVIGNEPWVASTLAKVAEESGSSQVLAVPSPTQGAPLPGGSTLNTSVFADLPVEGQHEDEFVML